MKQSIEFIRVLILCVMVIIFVGGAASGKVGTFVASLVLDAFIFIFFYGMAATSLKHDYEVVKIKRVDWQVRELKARHWKEIREAPELEDAIEQYKKVDMVLPVLIIVSVIIFCLIVT